MKYSLILFSTFLLLSSQVIHCQNSNTGDPIVETGFKTVSPMDTMNFATTNDLIVKAIEFHDNGDYANAIALLKRISPTDPEYGRGCYEMALSYDYCGMQEKALEELQEAQWVHYDDPAVMALEASITDDLGNPQKGIVILKKALLKWPYNSNLLYNLGICYLNAGFPDTAEAVFLKNLKIDPYHARTNLGLAHANYAMGRIAESYLAYDMGILMSPVIKNIQDYEHAITGKINITPRPYMYPYPAGYIHSAWDDLSALMKSEFAMKDNFEYPYAVNFTVCRQNYLLLKNIRYNASDTSVYNTFYGRFFSDIVQSGYLDAFMYYFLKNAGNETVNKWLNDNNAIIEKFVKHAQEIINSGRATCFSPGREAAGSTYYHYDENVNLQSIGLIEGSDQHKRGDFIELNTDGSINRTGKYVDGREEGEWLVFWPGGGVKQRLQYVHGLFDGVSYTYHPNGVVSGIYPMKNGKWNGKVENYTGSGRFVSSDTWVEGHNQGPGIYHNYNENFVREVTFVNDTSEGLFTEKWDNGIIKQEITFKRGKSQGKGITRYPNGKTESEFNYEKDVPTGKWSRYFSNGQESETGEYDAEGKFTGEYKSYDRKGNLSSYINRYNKGLIDGMLIEYFPAGKEKMRRTYRSDTLCHIECFDINGHKIYAADARENSIDYKEFDANGTLRTEGKRVHDKWNGNVRRYNPLGILTQDLQYDNGQLSGPQKIYYPSGILNEEYECDSNLVEGIYKTYFNNGHLQSAGHYKKGRLNGELIHFYSNDTVQGQSFYLNDVQVGRQLSYAPDGRKTMDEFFTDEGAGWMTIIYDSLGNKSDVWNYDYGTKTFIQKFPDGSTFKKLTLCDNKADGPVDVYYPNGQLASHSEYVSGKLTGKLMLWDHRGIIHSEFNFLAGERNGRSTWYDDGKPALVTDFEDGKYQGTLTGYYPNGKVQRTFELVNNDRNGYGDYFAADGSFMYRLLFLDDQVIAYTYMDKSGKMLPDIPVTKDTKEVIAYYPNGKVSARFELKNGLYHGSFKIFFNTGAPLKTISFVNGESHGEEKSWYANGKLREVIQNVYDTRSGKYASYYETGTKKQEGYYVNDSRFGIWHFYDRSGKETEKLKYYDDKVYAIEAIL